MNLYMAYIDADPKYSRVFENNEFGFWAVDIQRPLRLSVRITDDGIVALPQKGKDAVLVDLMIEAKEQLGDDEWFDYNSFMTLIVFLWSLRSFKPGMTSHYFTQCMLIKSWQT